jgi:hypothetical protein
MINADGHRVVQSGNLAVKIQHTTKEYLPKVCHEFIFEGGDGLSGRAVEETPLDDTSSQ